MQNNTPSSGAMQIRQPCLKESLVQKLVTDIKKKKELQGISPDFVMNQLLNYLRGNVKQAQELSRNFHPKSAAYRKIVKETRALLRRSFGLFRIDVKINDIHILTERLISLPKSMKANILKQILSAHSSTKERIPYYPELYRQIFRLSGKPKTIIDLGSGLNPFSIYYMGLHISLNIDLHAGLLNRSTNPGKLNYYAYDLSEEEVELLNDFFVLLSKENSFFKGKARILDASDREKLIEIPTADICFLFKMTDVLDKGKGHKASEGVIRNVPAKFVVVSFPTLTMSGKLMNFPRRRWIELMCRRLGYKFKVLSFPNEMFYVIEKSG